LRTQTEVVREVIYLLEDIQEMVKSRRLKEVGQKE
jgi:hypothetical protein